MKAAVWTAIGKLEIREVPLPALMPQQVRIRVRAAGLCITDLHIYTGKFAYGSPPHILGHEIAGEVCAVGNPTLENLLGRRVTVETSVGCGTCKSCKSGERHLCPDMAEIGFTPYNGGYAEYVDVPAENLVPLPEEVSYEEAAIVESVVCPIGALMRLKVSFGETVAVFGAGPAGISFIQGARAMGAGRIIAIERGGERCNRAKLFGADIAIDILQADTVTALLQETGGIGADLVCEAAGTPASIAAAIHSARRAGRIILYGIPEDGAQISFPATHIITNQLELHGAVGDPAAWAPLLQMVAAGKINLKDMVTHRISLKDIETGFDLLQNQAANAIKIIITP